MPAIASGLSKVANAQEPEEPQESGVLPPVEQWDYQTAEVNHRGEELPAGAQAWRPDGLPHFGEGVAGKLKSYWYNFTKDIPNTASVQEMVELWKQKASQTDRWMQGGTQTEGQTQAASKIQKNILDAFSGRGAELSEEQQKRSAELAVRQKTGKLTEEERAELKELGRGQVDQSALSGVRRAVGVGVTAGLDLFNAAAYGTKQAIGAYRGLAEGLQETGQGLPEVDLEGAAEQVSARRTEYQEMVEKGEINPHVTPPSITWQEAKDNLKASLINSPLGIAYNAIRTAMAPTEGKWDIVKDRMNTGWDSGRILYTQVYDPAVRYEYERRLNEGENPEFLALELQNPWAEMVGEVFLDPTNLIGVVAKGAKVSGKIDEAMEAGEALVKALDSTLDENVELFSKVSTDEGAQRIVQETAESYVKKTAERAEIRAQKYGWNQLTSTSQKNRLIRDMNNFFGTVIGGMVKDGRGADDIADILKYGILSVSDNVDEAMEGIMGLMNASVPKQFFSELGNDSLSTVRRMLTNSEGALDAGKITRALSSDNSIESLLKISDAAAAQRFASVDEMEKAAKAVEAGKATDQQVKLAKAYESVPEHIKTFTKMVEKPEKVKGVVNSGLGFFYFTVNPGVAVRNSISNKMFIMMDEGIGAFFEGGVFKGMNDIKGHLNKHLGYEYKIGDTFGSQAGKAPTLMAKSEAADALRVIDTRYTEAFGKITETALPFDDVLKQSGMTDSQFGLFKELVKKEGNMPDAMTAFNEMQGLADWRTLDFLNPTQVKGLKQAGNVWDDLLDLARNPDATIEQIDEFIDARIKAYSDNAAESANDVPGFGHNWKSSEDGAKFQQAVDAGHVSNADYTKMGQVQEAGEQAVDAYKDTLIRQIKALSQTDPERAVEISLKNQDFMRQAEVAGKTVKNQVDGMWQQVWKTKRSGKPSNRIWKELGFEGSPPSTEMAYFDELFAQARLKRSALWEQHFQTSIARSEELIKDLEKAGVDTNDLNNLFERARDLDAKAQELKSAFYLNNGKGYIGAPPKGTKLGQMDYDSTNQFLQEMGWNRGNADAIRNAVNKDLGKGYKTWQEVPWNEAVDAVGKRTGGVAEAATEVAPKVADAAKPIPTSDVKEFLVQAGVPDDVAEAWKVEQGYKEALNEIKAKMVDTPLGPDYSRLATRLQESTNKAKGAGFVTSDLLKKNKLTRQYMKELTGVMDKRAKKASDELLKTIETNQVIPVHPASADFSAARPFLETQKGFTETMEYLRSQIKSQWGNVSPTDGQAVSRALNEYGTKYANRLIDAKSMALKNAEYWRDFTLLGYSTDKKFGNLASSYAMPYAFWYSGTWRNMMERLVTDPQVIAGYSKYRHAVEQEHKFAPDWYRQQVKIDNLFGVELDNPLFFNLEATLNPLNGLTGADFNDRSKRLNWWTSTLDDMGKFGPSMWAPIQIATAISLSMQGNQDAARRWAGRVLPQSPAVKAASSLLFGKPVEVDPAVLAFGGDKPFDFFGAMDSYEEGRVARALGDVKQKETDSIMADTTLSSQEKKAMIAELEAKYTDIAYTHEGAEWEEAYRLATNLRAPGQITSPLLGVGFKARTQVDIQIDEMYTQMNMLMTMRDGMTKEDYQKGWETLREQFPYMDTVLLARKGGELRDGAYAYNVLARVPPGKSDDIFREMKIDDLAAKFYDNKGSMEGWRQADKDRFMSAILDIGATFAIPPDATKQEWQAAKNESGKMYDALTEKYGDDIFEKVTEYYGIKEASYQDGRLFLEMNPEIQDYLTDKNNMVAQNPLLYKYYGSLQTIESYYESNLRAELAEKHGADIFKIAAEYGSLSRLDDSRKEWRTENKEQSTRLFAYWDDLYAEGTERSVNEAVLRMYNSLPEADEPYLRGDVESIAQQALVEAVQGNQAATQQIVGQMPAPLQELISDYWAGEELPDAAIKELEFIAQRNNMSLDSLLVIAGSNR